MKGKQCESVIFFFSLWLSQQHGGVCFSQAKGADPSASTGLSVDDFDSFIAKVQLGMKYHNHPASYLFELNL